MFQVCVDEREYQTVANRDGEENFLRGDPTERVSVGVVILQKCE